MAEHHRTNPGEPDDASMRQSGAGLKATNGCDLCESRGPLVTLGLEEREQERSAAKRIQRKRRRTGGPCPIPPARMQAASHPRRKALREGMVAKQKPTCRNLCHWSSWPGSREAACNKRLRSLVSCLSSARNQRNRDGMRESLLLLAAPSRPARNDSRLRATPPY